MTAEPLGAVGLAMLLVYGAEIPASRGEGKPGIRCTVDASGAVLMQAVGFPDAPAAQTAIAAAHQACIDAELDVQVVPPDPYPARLVRRRAAPT